MEQKINKIPPHPHPHSKNDIQWSFKKIVQLLLNVQPNKHTTVNRDFFDILVENDPNAVDYRKVFVSIIAVLPIEGENKLGLAFKIFDCG